VPAYFHRLSADTFAPTELVGGGWNPDGQHIAPVLGLLTHLVEQDHAVRGGRLVLARASFDILGTLPLEPVTTTVRVTRPGRTIELVEAVLSHDDRPGLVLRAWILQAQDTADAAGTALPRVAGPDETESWNPATLWPGGFVGSVEVRRRQVEPGRALVWVRTDVDLIDAEPVSATAQTLGLIDIANGMTPRRDPREMGFANVDLTVHLFERPTGGWVGLDTTVSFGHSGVGLTHSTLHTVHGPIGTVAQSLTLRRQA